jgi:hypothetical protein
MAAPSLYEFSLIAGIAAGDDCDPAGQVEALDNVAGSASGVEAGIDGFLQSGHGVSR